MDHSTVSKLPINQLRSLAARLKLTTKGTRAAIILRITEHYEKYGWPEDVEMERGTEAGSERGENHASLLEIREEETRRPGTSGASYANARAYIAGPKGDESTRNVSSQINVQEIVQAVVQVLEKRQRSSDGTRGSPAVTGDTGSTVEINTSAINWQQLKFATKLIPVFSGKDEENVVKWLERIMCAANMYRLNDEVIVLAAISQLKNRAQE